MLALWNQFDDLFNDAPYRQFNRARRAPKFVPAVDIEERKTNYRLTADLPGFTADDVEITIEDGVLTLSGERKSEEVKEGDGYRRVERTFGNFRRAFTLPKGVSADGITARAEHGQFEVIIPKPEVETPRKVNISQN